jgi:hypothetical protein
MMQVNIKNTYNIIFQTSIFFKLQDVRGPLASIIPFTKFYGVILLFITNMGNMRKGSPLLNHLQAQIMVTQ